MVRSLDTNLELDFATKYTQLSGQHQWFYAAFSTAGSSITFTQAMTLDASWEFGCW
jgi:hypothetical protein